MLTTAQHKTLSFIRQFVAGHGYAPSLAEIAAGIGIRSKGAVHRYVQALADAGYIRLVPGRKRGIQLTDEAASELLSLPLLGRIAAGQPIEAIPGRDTVNLAEFFLGPERFALHVRGDSMIDAGILDGDTVIVEHRETARDGDIVVALIDNQEATLKRLKRRTDGAVALIPENRAMSTMVYSAARVSIQGVVVGVMRQYR